METLLDYYMAAGAYIILMATAYGVYRYAKHIINANQSNKNG